MIRQVLLWSVQAAVVYVSVVAVVHLLLAVTGAWSVIRHRRYRDAPSRSGRGEVSAKLPVSVVMVEQGDDPTVADRIEALASLDYPAFEVIVVSDGPIGAHLARAMMRLHAAPIDLIYRPVIATARVTACYHAATAPNVVVLEKQRTTSADAYNAGLNAARSPFVCILGVGSRLDRRALSRLMASVAEDPERIVAVSGIERTMCAAGAARRPLPILWSVIEGARTALTAAGLGPILGILLPPRGCLLVQKKAVLRVGGFVDRHGAEYADLLFRVRRALADQRLPRRMVFLPKPVAWIPGPESLTGLARRYHDRCVGAMGCVGDHLPTGTALLVGWRMIAPLIDVGVAVGVTAAFRWGLVDFSSLLLVWMSLLAVRTAYSSAAILLMDAMLAEDPSRWDVGGLFATAVLEPMIYRPVAAWWTLCAVWQYRRLGRHARLQPDPTPTPDPQPV